MKKTLDVNSAKDLRQYQNFLKNKSWGDGCPFELEWPFLSIPEMIQYKIIEAHLSKIIKDSSKKKNLGNVWDSEPDGYDSRSGNYKIQNC